MKPILLCAAVSLFAIPSAFAEMPGSPATSCQQTFTVGGPGVVTQFYGLVPYSVCYVRDGAVVLIKEPSQDAHDPSNWSDVVIFFEGGAPWQGGYATDIAYLSDQSTAGGIGGIQNDDFLALFQSLSTFSVESVLARTNTVYLPKNPNGPVTEYVAASYYSVQYLIQSNPGEPVPTVSRSLARFKAIYR